jgi:hypothetical protein
MVRETFLWDTFKSTPCSFEKRLQNSLIDQGKTKKQLAAQLNNHYLPTLRVDSDSLYELVHAKILQAG